LAEYRQAASGLAHQQARRGLCRPMSREGYSRDHSSQKDCRNTGSSEDKRERPHDGLRCTDARTLSDSENGLSAPGFRTVQSALWTSWPAPNTRKATSRLAVRRHQAAPTVGYPTATRGLLTTSPIAYRFANRLEAEVSRCGAASGAMPGSPERVVEAHGQNILPPSPPPPELLTAWHPAGTH
jgi:hypothetical protein